MEIIVSVSGDAEVASLLARLQVGFSNLTPLFSQYKDIAEHSVEKTFDTQTDPDTNQPWKSPLEQNYEDWKVAHGGSSEADLYLTGDLFRSVSEPTFTNTPSTANITAYAPYYSIYHESTLPRHKMPRRAFWGIRRDDFPMMNTTLQNYIKGILGAI